MKPTAANISYLSVLTGKSEDFVKKWFVEKRNMQMDSDDINEFKSTDRPSTSKFVKKTPQRHCTADANIIDLTQNTVSDDISLNSQPSTSKVNRNESITSIIDGYQVEELLAKFFLENMKPTIAHIKCLSMLTGKNEEFVKMWFAEKQTMQLRQCNLSRNQVPLAMLYFKLNPEPAISEYEALSHIVKADKLAVFRYFDNKRKH